MSVLSPVLSPILRPILSGVLDNSLQRTAFSLISLGPALWLSDTGNNAAQWDDLSGNGRHATQGTGASQPAIITNSLNGRQVRRFDGSNDFMVGSQLWSGANPGSIFVVYKPRATTGVFTVFGQTLGGTPGFWRAIQFRTEFAVGDPYFAGYQSDLTDNTAPDTNAKIAGFIYNGTAGYLYRNGVEINSGVLSLNTPDAGYEIGKSSSGEYANMDCAEIIAFQSALSDVNRQKIETYLSSKWGISI